jgi:hypothetical protein
MSVPDEDYPGNMYKLDIYIYLSLWKESNDGHQFHQYQQNEQSPRMLIEHL